MGHTPRTLLCALVCAALALVCCRPAAAAVTYSATGRPILLGALDPALVNNGIEDGAADFEACLRSSSGSGHLLMKFVIAGTGAVESAKVVRSSLPSPEVGGCFATVLQKLVFPQPKGGGIVIVKESFKIVDTERPEEAPSAAPAEPSGSARAPGEPSGALKAEAEQAEKYRICQEVQALMVLYGAVQVNRPPPTESPMEALAKLGIQFDPCQTEDQKKKTIAKLEKERSNFIRLIELTALQKSLTGMDYLEAVGCQTSGACARTSVQPSRDASPSRTLTGTVVARDGRPVAGVSVQTGWQSPAASAVLESQAAVVTDAQGRFVSAAPSGLATELAFIRVGGAGGSPGKLAWAGAVGCAQGCEATVYSQ